MTLLTKYTQAERYGSLAKLPEWLRKKEPLNEQLRAIRELLGMTQSQLAKRAGQNARLIRRLEAENELDPRLSTLLKAAKGLECELIVCFVPKKAILTILAERIKKKALMLIQLAKGTAALEEQEPESKLVKLQLKDLESKLSERLSQIWED